MSSNVEHGPARALVERALREELKPYGTVAGASAVRSLRAAADAHDAAHAALVQAVEAVLGERGWMISMATVEKLEAALKAAREATNE